jgi:hypothetical protein
MMARVLLILIVCLVLGSVGCNFGGFDDNKAVLAIEGTPVRLDAEYVMLTPQQVECGVQNDLWEQPVQTGKLGTGRLTAAGRELKFSDDVSIGDLRSPYVQIRGEFPMKYFEAPTVRDGRDPDQKLADSKVGVIIQHTCFPNPLPMMGVKKGKFVQDTGPIFVFRNNNGWVLDSVLH